MKKRHAHIGEERGKKRKLPMVYLQFFGGLLFVSSAACHQLSGVLCCPDLVGYGDTILVQLFIDRRWLEGSVARVVVGKEAQEGRRAGRAWGSAPKERCGQGRGPRSSVLGQLCCRFRALVAGP